MCITHMSKAPAVQGRMCCAYIYIMARMCAICVHRPSLCVLLQNTYPPEIKSWRHVVYTCYQPRSMASQQDLKMKAKAYQNYQITTHLPAQNIRVYDEDFAKRESPSVVARTSTMLH